MEMLKAESVQRSNGWSGQENSLLMQEVEKTRTEGKPIRIAFDRVAQRTGRKPNSVRNYYYMAMRQQPSPATPVRSFTCFSADEKKDLLVAVLTAQAQGHSVRRCVMDLAQGDKQSMLRYQNKYRSLIKNHPDIVRNVMKWMDEQRISYVDPYQRTSRAQPTSPSQVSDLTRQLGDQLKNLGETEAVSLLEGLLRLTNLAGARVVARWKAEEYDRLYKDYPHLFYQRDWFKEIANKMGVKCEIADQTIPGYVNAKFRFNVYLRNP